MGEIVIGRLWTMDEGTPAGGEQNMIIYDPIPRYMDGVDVSDDPLLEVLLAVYLISDRTRREHLDEDVQQAVR
ncbi:hypothetical protein LTR85_005382 [Meristemomyces frigidus]|nr:hypothetical protein LTR85_005382 [Meristemomyces frigidus]